MFDLIKYFKSSTPSRWDIIFHFALVEVFYSFEKDDSLVEIVYGSQTNIFFYHFANQNALESSMHIGHPNWPTVDHPDNIPNSGKSLII